MRAVFRMWIPVLAAIAGSHAASGEPPTARRIYAHELRPIPSPQPLLDDYPQFVQAINETARFEAPPLITDDAASLSVRAWRFSYHARGIIEVPNQLRGDQTALIVVHPWGIDDGQGWKTPQPAGVAFQCTPVKNELLSQHIEHVLHPLVQSLRDEVSLVMYSLPGAEDSIRKNLYRSVRGKPGKDARSSAQNQLSEKLARFEYRGQPIPQTFTVSSHTPTADYFRNVPGLDASAKYNNDGFWELPIPVHAKIDVAVDDVVIYDGDGYGVLKQFLKEQGIRHVLLAGYNTDMCVCTTTAGYKNLREDFNVFLIGDATVATFPANPTPAVSTTAAVSRASLDLFITQVSWIKVIR